MAIIKKANGCPSAVIFCDCSDFLINGTSLLQGVKYNSKGRYLTDNLKRRELKMLNINSEHLLVKQWWQGSKL